MSADGAFGASGIGNDVVEEVEDKNEDFLKSSDEDITEEDVADPMDDPQFMFGPHPYAEADKLAALPLALFLRELNRAPVNTREKMISQRETGVRRGIPMYGVRTMGPLAGAPIRDRFTPAERQRFHAYGVQQAKSAYASAFAGSGIDRPGLTIVDNVKDAVKFIVRKLAERVERW